MLPIAWYRNRGRKTGVGQGGWMGGGWETKEKRLFFSGKRIKTYFKSVHFFRVGFFSNVDCYMTYLIGCDKEMGGGGVLEKKPVSCNVNYSNVIFSVPPTERKRKSWRKIKKNEKKIKKNGKKWNNLTRWIKGTAYKNVAI